MKKSIFIIISFFVLTDLGFSQTAMNWRIGVFSGIYDKLNVFSNNNQLIDMNTVIGTSFDLNVNFKKNIGQAGMNLGYNTKSKEQILTNLNSVSGNLFFGRQVSITNNYSAGLLLGYSIQSLQVNGYNKKEQNYNTLNVNNSTGMLQLQSFAQCVAFKLENNFFNNNLIVSISYNYALTQKDWRLYSGSLTNAPSDNLSNYEISLKYSIINKKW